MASATVIPCRSISACTLKLPRASLRIVRLPTCGRLKAQAFAAVGLRVIDVGLHALAQGRTLIRPGEPGLGPGLARRGFRPFLFLQRLGARDGFAEQFGIVIAHGIEYSERLAGSQSKTAVPPIMKILVSNDDGYLATGINVLTDALEKVADVVVVAPDRNRSAASNSLTVHSPLRVHKVAENRFRVDGTPSDCVHLGADGFPRLRA